MRVIDNTDPTKGRTCYVGDRKGDKMLRGYEKGREMALRFPHGSLVAVDGHRIEDIYRVEVELKADTRPIPWDAVWGSDQYFAGAYPFCADLLPDIEPDILARRPERSAQLGLRAVLENVRVQYGRAIFTAMVAYDGDITAVWDRIVGDELHPELVAAGVLLVEHE
jgi:DNA relaxase NicK